MKKRVLWILAALALGALAACSLPGQSFPGGPSPWLPAGAPNSAYPSPAGTAPVTPPATGSQGNGAGKAIPTAVKYPAEGGIRSVTMRAGSASSMRVAQDMFDSLLVICTGNICRSPMAEALFAKAARGHGKQLDVASAGTAALIGHPPPREAIELMAQRQIDITGHRAQQVTGEIARRYELILVMELPHQQYLEANWPMLKGRVHQLLANRDEGVGDPYGRSKDAYRKSLAQIDEGVDQWSRMLL